MSDGLFVPRKRIITALESTLKAQVAKLHLELGDALVVHDTDTLEVLRGIRIPGINFPVPILYIPRGGLEVATKDMLQNALSIIQAAEAEEIEAEQVAEEANDKPMQ